MIRTRHPETDELDRWNGYLDPDTHDPVSLGPILRNRVGATTWAQLAAREDAFVAVRAVTLHTYQLPSSFDLDGLREIHRHLFQDVYDWAGELRTVTIGKCEPFAAPDEVEPVMARVADRIAVTEQLRSVPEESLRYELARIHHETNVAHPFRLGNGRAVREFLTALAAESGHSLDWSRTSGEEESGALRRARHGDLKALTAMYATILGRIASPVGELFASGAIPGRTAGVWR